MRMIENILKYHYQHPHHRLRAHANQGIAASISHSLCLLMTDRKQSSASEFKETRRQPLGGFYETNWTISELKSLRRDPSIPSKLEGRRQITEECPTYGFSAQSVDFYYKTSRPPAQSTPAAASPSPTRRGTDDSATYSRTGMKGKRSGKQTNSLLLANWKRDFESLNK